MGDTHQYEPAPDVVLEHPEWSKNATIYQINTRQFTAAGTIAAAADHLPRLRDLGVVILWMMPVHEIGAVNRKGTLGSPYAVKDYYSVSAELGTVDDLRRFVQAAHELGMYVILDWVANHTAWDSNLVTEHPEWYARDWKGDLTPTPWWDWPDIIDLDYRHAGLRRYMTEAMKYWVSDIDVDGFRCDVAGFVPTDFWNTARRELDAIKPVFMLAEWESRDLHREAFDMTYAWSWNEAMHHIAMGRTDLVPLHVYYSWNEKAYPRDSMRMMFVSNHDANAWEGTEFEQFGDALEAAIVLSVVGSGLPLVYNGQEAGNDKRLEFFEKDPIEWREHPMGEFYRRLFALKRINTALWNGRWGARMVDVPTTNHTRVLSFLRSNDVDRVFAVLNFSDAPQDLGFLETLHHGTYTEFFSGEPLELTAQSRLTLEPWGYRVYVAEPREHPHGR